MVAGVGGAVLVVSLFLNWSEGGSAFDSFSGIDLILLVIGVAALAYAAVPMMSAAALPGNAARIIAGLGLVAIGWSLGWDLEDPGAGFGAWLGLVASVAVTYGAFEAASEPVSAPPPERPVPPPVPSAPAGPPTA
jgi:hypothetical protein